MASDPSHVCCPPVSDLQHLIGRAPRYNFDSLTLHHVPLFRGSAREPSTHLQLEMDRLRSKVYLLNEDVESESDMTADAAELDPNTSQLGSGSASSPPAVPTRTQQLMRHGAAASRSFEQEQAGRNVLEIAGVAPVPSRNQVYEVRRPTSAIAPDLLAPWAMDSPS